MQQNSILAKYINKKTDCNKRSDCNEIILQQKTDCNKRSLHQKGIMIYSNNTINQIATKSTTARVGIAGKLSLLGLRVTTNMVLSGTDNRKAGCNKRSGCIKNQSATEESDCNKSQIATKFRLRQRIRLQQKKSDCNKMLNCNKINCNKKLLKPTL